MGSVESRDTYNILFLDVDGVLNTDSSRLEYGLDRIDPDKVGLIARIVANTDCKIVLSSFWRISNSDLKLVKIALRRAGVKLFAKTPVIADGFVPRSVEIKYWLNLNHKIVKRYAILDDDPNASDDTMLDNMFLTKSEEGLTEKLSQLIIQHFKATLSPLGYLKNPQVVDYYNGLPLMILYDGPRGSKIYAHWDDVIENNDYYLLFKVADSYVADQGVVDAFLSREGQAYYVKYDENNTLVGKAMPYLELERHYPPIVNEAIEAYGRLNVENIPEV